MNLSRGFFDIVENIKMKYERANQLQFWRFLAFLIIFQCHASQWAPFQIDNIRALLGVFFFVLLSGAMSSYALHQKAFRNDSKGILDHKIKSVIRAYPLYIITNCFTMAYLIPIDLVTSHSFKDLAKEFINFILTATMLQPGFWRQNPLMPPAGTSHQFLGLVY